MNFIIDAHMHTGTFGNFFVPGFCYDVKGILSLMDYLNIERSISIDLLWLNGYFEQGIKASVDNYNLSKSRICFLGVFDPKESKKSIKVLEQVLKHPGFLGIKIHPSFHNVPAEDIRYDAIWKFADENNLPILTHSWSTSEYNPVQILSLPERFRVYIQKYPDVKLVFAHAGGRGDGREQAIDLVNEFSNVYLDISGDIYCYNLIPDLVNRVPVDRIIFGSDFGMIDPKYNLGRVIMSDISDSIKLKILRNNAINVYKFKF